MLTYIVRRLLLLPPTLIGMTAIVFFALAMAPGGIGASLLSRTGEMRPDQRKVREEYLNRRYGLDRPKHVQYLHWLNKVSPIGFATVSMDDPRAIQATKEQTRLREPVEQELEALRREQAQLRAAPADQADAARMAEVERQIAQAEARRKAIRISPQAGDVNFAQPRVKFPDLGDSFVRGRPVNVLVAESLPITITLEILALPLSYALAIWLGIQQARQRGSFFDFSVSAGTLALWAIPTIWVGVLLIGFLANQEYVRWFPATGLNSLNEASLQFLPSVSGFRSFVGFLAHVLVHVVAVVGMLLALLSLAGLVIALVNRSRESSRLAIRLGAAGLGLFAAAAALVRMFPVRTWMILVLLIAAIAMLLIIMARRRAYELRGRTGESPPTWQFAVWIAVPLMLLLSLLPLGLPQRVASPPQLGWLLDRTYHLVLPVICLTYANFAFLSRLTRGALLDNLYSDFVRTARAKGLSERIVLYRHAFRNSLIPLITVLVNLLPAMVAGAVVVENIFGINGMGKLAVDAAFQRDFELLLSITLVTAVLQLVGYLLADILYAVADPRVSYE